MNNNHSGIIILIVVALILAGAYSVLNLSQSARPARTPTPDIANAFEGCLAAQKIIKENILKAPATAQFSKCPLEGGRREGNLIYVEGYVDAQNSFGAMIRTHYQATVRYQGKNTWKMEAFDTSR